MRALREWLGLEPGAPASGDDTETVRRIAGELGRLEPDRARFLASFAYVLARVANADLDVTDDEVRAMERIVAETGELPADQAALAVQIAKSQAVNLGGTEDYLVTRQFRGVSERGDRIALIRCLFAVAAADGSISQLENQRISQIGSELGLTAAEVTACRLAFREHLAVLKDLP